MKTDISNRTDIEKLINAFYDKVKTDPGIGYFFTEIVPVNWEKHLPVMYDFWENLIFKSGNYDGNAMMPHQHLHEKSPMKMEHFKQWILLFTQTVDELFEGENAEIIKQRAISIATLMQIKIFTTNTINSK
jgi:hemoglobin